MTDDYYSYIQGFFKKWAGIYDIIVFLLAGMRGKVVEITAALKGARVLDVATGTGKQAFAFGKKGFNVTGVDLSEDMLQIARKNNKFANVKLEAGDATALAYPENSFDVTTVSFALHDMPPEVGEKVLEEMVRVTRPGGIVTVVDYDLPKNRLIKNIAYAVIKSYESKYYPLFVKNNLPGLMEKKGIRIEKDRKVMFGTGRIIRGIKA
jgi:ubiquinone/menaquinone biosynthesis C-methylase UbiE